jgi:ribosomal protein L29
MELKELKQKSVSDLHHLLAESRDNLREMRFKDANKQLKDIREIRKTKRLISRIMTLLNAGKKDEKKTVKKEEVKQEEKKEEVKKK